MGEQVVSEGNFYTRKVISSGLSSVGYDIRLAPVIRRFKTPGEAVETGSHSSIDPLNFDMETLVSSQVADHFFIPPNGYVLGVSNERFCLPDDVAGICLTKSTYARCGLLCNTTPLEPGWQGYLTLELANLTPLPLKVYVNQGIAQVLFFRTSSRPRTTYSDRKGKYMDQPPVPVGPRVK